MKTPLKTILRNFLNHVEDLDARQRSNDDQYEVEFQRLKQLTDRLKEDAQYSCSHGHKEVNRPKNRYKDIVPYDFCRVILPEFSEIPGSDYINASYIKGASGACAYVAAQGPLPNTIVDFWRMIWACDIKVVIMACNQHEAGKYKCETYWPEENEPRHYGTISVELVKESQVCVDFLVRTLSVKQQDEVKLIYQFHYTTWPDHGVPVTVYPILELVRLVRDCQASETVPIVVHCSAGCGRTGTICAIDFVWACLRSGKLNESFCLYDIVSEMRQQRIAMVQTKEQYILIHRAVASMFEHQLRVIDCHTYVNLDEDGEPLLWKGLGQEKVENVKCLPAQTLKNGSNALKENISYGAEADPNNKNNRSSRYETSVIENSALHTCSKKIDLLKDENCELMSNSSKSASVPADNSLLKCCKEDNSDISHHKAEEFKALPPSADNKNNKSSVDSKSNRSSHEADETIPFIDDDDDDEANEDVQHRPQGGRAYINLPSCNSISKIINCFDPFVDKISVGTDESSPEMESCESSSALYVSPKLKHPVPVDIKSDLFSLPCKSEGIPQSQNNLVTLKSAPALTEASHTRTLSDIPERSRLAYSADMGNHELLQNKVKVKSQNIREETPQTVSEDECVLFKMSTNPQINVPSLENKLNRTVTFHNNKPEETTRPESKINSSGDSPVLKQIGKASVIRRPSIAKLKALFEKSGADNNQQGCEKRSLFRHHSHHISRAGSAPPSLDCVNRHSDMEKQSLLEMVTRKFRSSSVKSERELQKDKSPSGNRTSPSKKCGNSSFSHLRENIGNLTRNMSLSFSKNSAKIAQPFPQTKWHDKTRLEPDHPVTFDKTDEKITLHPTKDSLSFLNSRKNTQWYDSTVTESLSKVYVKPLAETSSLENNGENKAKASSEHGSSFIASKSNSSSHRDKAAQPVNVSVCNPLVTSSSNKKPMLSVPLLCTTNKTDPKETSVPFCNSVDPKTSTGEVPLVEKNVSAVSSVGAACTATEIDKCVTENCKSEALKSPENELEIHLAKSKFYTQIGSNADKPPVLPLKKRVGVASFNLIPAEVRSNSESTVPRNSKFFWPSNSFGSSGDQSLKLNLCGTVDTFKDQVTDHKEKPAVAIESENIEEPVAYKPETVSCVLRPVHPLYVKNMSSEGQIEKKTVQEAPPALPKKMFVGKNRSIVFPSIIDVDDRKSTFLTECTPIVAFPEVSPDYQVNKSDDIRSDKNTKPDESEDKNISATLAKNDDVYMNVNVVAQKNIEQIENTLRNHPRGAIIDLTSRHSYSMEEELAVAVKELSEPVKKPHAPFRTAMDAKLAGYEVIWPESKQIKPVKKTEEKDSSRLSAVTSFNKSDLLSRSLQPGDLFESLNWGKKLHHMANKTGPCYSPPLRRNVNSNFSLSKSQSCVTLDWQELEKKDVSLDSRLPTSENKSTETLVSEAVVELTTLLDELTTRTLSEDVDIHTRSGPAEMIGIITSGTNSSDSVNGSSFSAVEKSPEIVDKDKSTFLQIDKQSKSPGRSGNAEAFAVAIKPLSSTRNTKDEEIVFHFPPPPPIPPPPHDEPVQEIFEVRCKNGMLLISETPKEESDKHEKDVAEAHIQTDTSKKAFVGKDQMELATPMPLPRKTKQSTLVDPHSQSRSPSCSVTQKPEDSLFSSKNELVLQDPKMGEPVKTCNNSITKLVSLVTAGNSRTAVGNQDQVYVTSDKNTFLANQNSECGEKNVPGNFSETNTQELPKNSTEEQVSSSQCSSQYSDAQTIFHDGNIGPTHEQKLEVAKCAVKKESITETFPSTAHAPHAMPPRYENINLIGSDIQFCKQESSGEEKDSSHSAESLNLSADDATPKNVITCAQGGKFELQSSDPFSIYGKIKKVPPNRICAVAPLQLKENTSSFQPVSSDHLSNKTDEKKRPTPSRKSERAPPPPSVQPRMSRGDEKSSSLKRIPSRKHERAPQPPALSTSASCTSLAPSGKLETCDVHFARNTHPQAHQTKHRLHALYENISEVHNITPSCKFTGDTQNVMGDSDLQPTMKVTPHGLKHSHSDASVFLALRESKLKHPHPKQKPPNGEQNTEVLKDSKKVSSGTSGSSSDDSENSLKLNLSSQEGDALVHQKLASHRLKRDVPVAPPRSKRRSTMEIHYIKKTDSKETSDTSKQISVKELVEIDCLQTSSASIEDEPPAIPLKTKEAFEVPEEFRRKANTLPHQKNIDIMLKSTGENTSEQVEIRKKPTSALLRKEVMNRESPTSSPPVRKGDYKRRSVPAVPTGVPWCPEVKNVAPRKPLQ